MADHALKAAMRLEAMQRRDGLDLDDRLEWDQQIADGLLASRLFGSRLLDSVRGVVAGYWPMRSEADPRPIMVALKERGIALALPAMHRPGGDFASEVLFRPWMPWEPLVPGGFGTLVPVPEAGETGPAVLLVPLLAFDRQCRRLGYGKGHYDRAIARLQAKGDLLTIGIAYAAQEVAEVPTEPHDRVLHAIATERGVIMPGIGRAEMNDDPGASPAA
jgi:5-formyltetrahydrofolate cyclo-ligase